MEQIYFVGGRFYNDRYRETKLRCICEPFDGITLVFGIHMMGSSKDTIIC